MLVTGIAVIGIGVNLLAVWAMSKANRQSLKWEVSSGMPALSGHIYVNHGIDCHDVRRAIETMLHDRFDIAHTTLQTDHAVTGEIVSASCAFESGDGDHSVKAPGRLQKGNDGRRRDAATAT